MSRYVTRIPSKLAQPRILMLLVTAHPTLSEAFKEAAMGCSSKPIHA